MPQIQSLLSEVSSPSIHYRYYNLKALPSIGFSYNEKMPYIVKILLESVIRNAQHIENADDQIKVLASWTGASSKTIKKDFSFFPGRVILQDFTGVPCLVDLVAMRQAMIALGKDPKKINPQIPCALVIDHSVQIDHFGSSEALQKNKELEFQRNKERYEFLKWGSENLDNFEIIPPATGIVHQVNLEYLAQVVLKNLSQNVPPLLSRQSCRYR